MRQATIILCMLGTLNACGILDAYDPVDAPAPSIAIETLDGTRVDLAALRGHPVVVHFWLPWCHVCASEVPALNEVARNSDADVRFLAVSLDPDIESVRSRANRFGLSLPLVVARGEVLGPMHVAAAPSTVFIDRNGLIRAAVNGPRDVAFLSRRVREIVE